jgi:UDP-N-acetyl-D-glucosamine dehydrogenase
VFAHALFEKQVNVNLSSNTQQPESLLLASPHVRINGAGSLVQLRGANPARLSGSFNLDCNLDPHLALMARIQAHDAKVAIIGLGYVGLPLAQAFASVGLPVLGYDADQSKIDKLERGESYIAHIQPQRIRDMLKQRFEPTTDASRLAEADAILICVPTPLNEAREPDLSFVVSATRKAAATLRRGQLIVLESTTYPGTTRQVVLPILEANGLRAGCDFFLAFSPEREDPGNTTYSTTTIPKVVGGLDSVSLELAATLYAQAVVNVVRVSSPEVAEACKILENTYRAVNIALVNELKVLYDRMGINVWEVIEAAKTKPFGFQAFYPGPGLGGHCIPVDPFYLTWVARRHGLNTRFIELAGEINTSMPAFVVDKVGNALNELGRCIKGSRIALLGMAYKRDVEDARESPSFEVMKLLVEKGAIVSYNDPHVARLSPGRRSTDVPLVSQLLTPEYLAEQDCTVILTDHSAYDWDFVVGHSSRVVDTRNATARVTTNRDRIVHA